MFYLKRPMPSKRCVFIVISNLFWEAYEIWKDMTMIENLWEQFQHSAHLSEAPNTSVREDRLFSKQYQFWVLNFIHTGTFLLTSVSDQNCRVELSNTAPSKIFLASALTKHTKKFTSQPGNIYLSKMTLKAKSLSQNWALSQSWNLARPPWLVV